MIGQKYQTPDLTSVVQEIINRSGWTSGNAIAFIVTGTGHRAANSYNSGAVNAPKLYITYQSEGTSLPTPTATTTSGPTPTATPTVEPTPTTIPTPLPSGSVRFAVIGDFGNGSTDEGLVANLVNSWNPDFVVTTGDNNYPDGDISTMDDHIGKFYSQYIGNYTGIYGTGSATNRFWPSMGNHDWHTPTCDDAGICTGAHFDYFTLPGNERYYDVDMGLVKLYAIDSDVKEPDGRVSNSIQANWLQNKLTESTSCFDIVYFHHPPYSSGQHGSILNLRWPFATWGADAVLNGHDHLYERIEAFGIPYFVNGAGGAALYPFTNIGTLPAGVTSNVRYNADHGAMLITATTTGITYEFYNTQSVLIDSYTVAKNCSGDPTPTPTPTLEPTPTTEPTATAEPTPTVEPTATPTPIEEPTATPTIDPTPTPSASPTAEPTSSPTPVIEPTPTDTPLPTETATATPTPTATPSAEPTPTPTPTPTSLIYSFIPVADAYVVSTKPTTNYGTLNRLVIDAKPVTFGYMRFDLSVLSGKTITNAELKIKIVDAAGGLQKVYEVLDNSWLQTAVNYNNKPALGNQIATNDGGIVGLFKIIPLTSHVLGKSGQVFSIGFDSTNMNSLGFYSLERPAINDKPTLVIEAQ